MLPLNFYLRKQDFCQTQRIYNFGKNQQVMRLTPASLIGKPVRIRRSPATVMASRLQDVTEAMLWEGAARR